MRVYDIRLVLADQPPDDGERLQVGELAYVSGTAAQELGLALVYYDLDIIVAVVDRPVEIDHAEYHYLDAALGE